MSATGSLSQSGQLAIIISNPREKIVDLTFETQINQEHDFCHAGF